MKKLNFLMLAALLIFQSCKAPSGNSSINGLETAVNMADSEIKLFPEPWAVDFNPRPIWNYTQGLIAQSMVQVWKTNNNATYYNYALKYADMFIDSTGYLSGYKTEDYNIDCVNSGKFLFDIYENTKDERYKKAIIQLRGQLLTHPRTNEGGFWHKLRYPHQMWLDGLYMAAPFYAKYAEFFNEPELFDDILNQFETIHKHTYNPEIGLNYHAWDESREQQWADSITGRSPHFWGRAMGWYAMALVDVLDFFPESHHGREKIITILNQVAGGIKKYQDPKSNLWYQVLDQGTREGNYLEATASSMFAYSMLKATRLGYLPAEYKIVGIKAYEAIVSEFIKSNEDGTISLTRCCSVAGLGGKPYRDGSFEYYISEPIRDNDPKGVGPFIMASLEYDMK